jgi:sec-independent protein translocase protein TatC
MTGAPVTGVAVVLAPDGQPAAAAEMPFLDHLEELRWHLFKSLGGIAVAVVVCFVFADWIINNILLAQTHKEWFMYRFMRIDAVDVILQNRSITGQFFAYYGTVFASAIVAGSPVIVYQIWKFIEPGLYPSEKRGVRFGALFATFFFALGITFGYLVLSPLSLQFFANFQISTTIINEFDISKYFSQIITLTFGAGLLFELPVVVFVLAKLGIVTGDFLQKSWRYAIVVILILAAVITPGTDPLSLVVMALPLVMLYQFSIVMTRVVERGKRREEARLAAEAAASGAPLPTAIVTPADALPALAAPPAVQPPAGDGMA